MEKQFMKLAFDCAKNSKAKRLKVGAVIVDSTNRIISSGHNHMPKNYSDVCEYYDTKNDTLITKDELIHAEEDAIAYAARFGHRCEKSIIFITDSPCLSCAKLIYSAGIKKVIYCRPYRLTEGIDFLKNVGVEVEQLNFDYERDK